VICPERLEAFLEDLLEPIADLDVTVLQVPEGEEAKQAEVAEACWEALGEEGFTRSDAVVTVGGGATTDLGGFVAATWLRGVRVVHVPTTLLAMVDAAVGGKTGINTGSGKNLVGAFHEPAGVLCDLALLDTLPADELRAGLGEVVKCGFIADPEILRLVEESAPEELTASSPVLRELVERAIRVKIDVVVDDLKETGGSDGHPGREVLNYGHTLAHAIERVEGYRIRHGEAVAIGCVFVAELARRAGRLPAAVADRHRTAFARVGLPTTYAGASFEDLHAAMRVDKKARGSQLRFVVLDDLARPVVLAGPSEEDLRAAYAAIGGSS
jgi:3-dehydroquinate synthase